MSSHTTQLIHQLFMQADAFQIADSPMLPCSTVKMSEDGDGPIVACWVDHQGKPHSITINGDEIREARPIEPGKWRFLDELELVTDIQFVRYEPFVLSDVASSETSLAEERDATWERAFEAWNFPLRVAETGGREMSGGYYSQRVYLDNPDGGDSIAVTFTVDFAPGKPEALAIDCVDSKGETVGCMPERWAS
ncbi:hypothetical protein A3709_20825 [Halioglobus sp. HI00S01]|uniref:hypothetical protein n=1 Tax=Halioglobus sp. HI00S01 TaxID=1822214 RepID=UPI0007C33880|nr:hypothetical protein [Halioglobus sp. HI00S01]KZX58059.1 hypothetical protein A3709_20825 [Halioglobus sp. HI00S01]